MRNRGGVSLAELLVVLVFTTSFLTVASTFFVAAKEHSQWIERQSSLHRTSLRLSEQLRRDGALAIDVRLDSPEQLTLILHDQTKVVYQSSSGVLLRLSTGESPGMQRESFPFSLKTRFYFQLGDNPKRIECHVLDTLPGVESATRSEGLFQAVIGSRVPGTSSSERGAK